MPGKDSGAAPQRQALHACNCLRWVLRIPMKQLQAVEVSPMLPSSPDHSPLMGATNIGTQSITIKILSQHKGWVSKGIGVVSWTNAKT